jgi:hypothetical protein
MVDSAGKNREQQRAGADFQEHRLGLANAEIRRQRQLAEQAQNAPAITLAAPIPGEVGDHRAAGTGQDDLGDLRAASRHQRSRQHQ